MSEESVDTTVAFYQIFPINVSSARVNLRETRIVLQDIVAGEMVK